MYNNVITKKQKLLKKKKGQEEKILTLWLNIIKGQGSWG